MTNRSNRNEEKREAPMTTTYNPEKLAEAIKAFGKERLEELREEFPRGRLAECAVHQRKNKVTLVIKETRRWFYYLAIDGDAGPYITLCSGTDLDARFVARDITEKMHALGKSDERWDNAICRWENTPGQGNRLKI